MDRIRYEFSPPKSQNNLLIYKDGVAIMKREKTLQEHIPFANNKFDALINAKDSSKSIFFMKYCIFRTRTWA